MAMNMSRAFNSMMESQAVRVVTGEGEYDENNVWVPGKNEVNKIFYAVITVGNKYSQFDEGISVDATEGGERHPNYRTMYVKQQWPILCLQDVIYFRRAFYKVLQQSDEDVFGFQSYLIEKLKNYKLRDLE